MRRWTRALASAGVVAGAWLSSSCAPSGFAAESLVQTVRILASASVDLTTLNPMTNPSPSYAQPGDTVSLQVLAYDGRTTQPEPMTIYWLPFVCEDPEEDAYYACFQQIGAGEDGGAPDGGDAGVSASGGIGALRPGIDLTPFLPSGPSYQFKMPSDVITSHTPVPGSTAYGLAILFNVACAGHLELLPPIPGNDNPQQIPVGCFDTGENQLGPDDWVLGYTRVYAFGPGSLSDGGTDTNANPVISSIDINGQTQPVTLVPNTTQIYVAQGFQSSACTSSSSSKCPHIPVGPNVPESSWELDPGSTDVDNKPLHEELWADFYSTFGSFDGSTGLLYDATTGSLGGPSVTDAQFEPPNAAGDGTIWIVVHDNRGGAAWVTVPVQVQ
jgi:hypothetical protein